MKWPWTHKVRYDIPAWLQHPEPPRCESTSDKGYRCYLPDGHLNYGIAHETMIRLDWA